MDISNKATENMQESVYNRTYTENMTSHEDSKQNITPSNALSYRQMSTDDARFPSRSLKVKENPFDNK